VPPWRHGSIAWPWRRQAAAKPGLRRAHELQCSTDEAHRITMVSRNAGVRRIATHTAQTPGAVGSVASGGGRHFQIDADQKVRCREAERLRPTTPPGTAGDGRGKPVTALATWHRERRKGIRVRTRRNGCERVTRLGRAQRAGPTKPLGRSDQWARGAKWSFDHGNYSDLEINPKP
jgi:hypothetical protein